MEAIALLPGHPDHPDHEGKRHKRSSVLDLKMMKESTLEEAKKAAMIQASAEAEEEFPRVQSAGNEAPRVLNLKGEAFDLQEGEFNFLQIPRTKKASSHKSLVTVLADVGSIADEDVSCPEIGMKTISIAGKWLGEIKNITVERGSTTKHGRSDFSLVFGGSRRWSPPTSGFVPMSIPTSAHNTMTMLGFSSHKTTGVTMQMPGNVTINITQMRSPNEGFLQLLVSNLDGVPSNLEIGGLLGVGSYSKPKARTGCIKSSNLHAIPSGSDSAEGYKNFAATAIRNPVKIWNKVAARKSAMQRALANAGNEVHTAKIANNAANKATADAKILAKVTEAKAAAAAAAAIAKDKEEVTRQETKMKITRVLDQARAASTKIDVSRVIHRDHENGDLLSAL